MFVLVVIVYLGTEPTLAERERVIAMQEFNTRDRCESVAKLLNAEVVVVRGGVMKSEYRVFRALCVDK